MLNSKDGDQLDSWVGDAPGSLVSSFAERIQADKLAMWAAIAEPTSYEQVEGEVTKLKLVKLQICGGAKIDLLQARLIGAQ